MHINRKPGEQVEVDWAGDPAMIIDPDTGEIIKAYIFVGVMTYSQYAYVEAFLDMKQRAWINAHVHMYEFFLYIFTVQQLVVDKFNDRACFFTLEFGFFRSHFLLYFFKFCTNVFLITHIL